MTTVKPATNDFLDHDPNPPVDTSRRYQPTGEIRPEDKGLLDLLDRDIVVWIPEVGDKIIGKLIAKTTAKSEYGEYPLLELDTADGALVQVHAFGTIFANEIERRNPSIGDRVGIQYVKDLPNPNGKQPMKQFRVVVQPAPSV